MTPTAMRSFVLVAPYAAWMAMMSICPATAGWYAARTGVVAALLAWSTCRLAAVGRLPLPSWRGVLAGLIAGIGVFVVWIAPETWLFPSAAVAAGAVPYAPGVCGWPLTLAKLAGSAFVISVAEELFFRRWLVDFAGFWWMVALFAVEHGPRWHVGALTGVAYGLLARRLGLWAAIVAHAVTNLVLGVYVVRGGHWQFW